MPASLRPWLVALAMLAAFAGLAALTWWRLASQRTFILAIDQGGLDTALRRAGVKPVWRIDRPAPGMLQVEVTTADPAQAAGAAALLAGIDAPAVASVLATPWAVTVRYAGATLTCPLPAPLAAGPSPQAHPP